MRSWAKILVGFLAALVLLCILGGVLLVQSGTAGRLKEFGGGIFGLSQNAKGIEALEGKFPFQEPPDGALSEERFIPYLEVRRATKPSADRYEAWMKAHGGAEDGDFKDASEVIRLTGEVMQSFRKALEAQKMSPREFAWMDRKVREALSQPGGGSLSETERDLLDALRKVSENPRLAPEERADLAAKVKKAEERAGAGKEPPSPDAALCAKYRNDLEETSLGEFSSVLVQGFAQSGHGRHGRRHSS